LEHLPSPFHCYSQLICRGSTVQTPLVCLCLEISFANASVGKTFCIDADKPWYLIRQFWSVIWKSTVFDNRQSLSHITLFMTGPLMDLALQVGVPNLPHGVHPHSIQIFSCLVSSKCPYLLFQPNIEHVPHGHGM